MFNALFAVFYREYQIRITNLVWIMFDMLVPLLYLLVFGLAFTRTMGQSFVVEGQAVDYSAFFLGGVLAMASFGVAMNTSWGWFMDREAGIFYEMLTYPISRRQHLLGKVLFNLLLAVVEALLVLGGAALVLGIPILWARLPLTIAAMLVGTAGWFFCFSIFSLRIRRNDLYQTILNAIYFVLMFASNMFYPLDPLPGWLKTMARGNPITWQVDLLRYATIGSGDGRLLVAECAMFGAFTVAAFLLAARAMRSQD